MAEYILELCAITKEFPGVKALDGVDCHVRQAEIHGLVGENGAGKSTLMKVLSGVYPAGSYTGEIRIEDQTRRFQNIKESEAAGVAIIHQELSLVKELDVCENILLGNETQRFGIMDWDAGYRKVEAALKRVGLAVSPAQQVKYLGVGEQQLVEIAKALSKNARILILDEPTAALSDTEARRLLIILNELRTAGVTCIYISHRLEEVLEITDRVTVLRDGRTVCTLDTPGLDKDTLIRRMVGRELTQLYPRRERERGEMLFEVEGWTVADADTGRSIGPLGFQIRRGEILGLAGLVGAGRSEFVMSLFGAWGGKPRGVARLHGQTLALGSPQEAIRAGLGLATEDRKRYGLVLPQDIRSNITLASLRRVARHGVLDRDAEIRVAENFRRDLTIKAPTVTEIVGHLSGGNQQKVVLAKWLMTEPRVLILDEPTRGIDVGAKAEIYGLINDIVDQGVAVLLISSDLPELLGVCDRILVMHNGRLTGDLERSEATQEAIMRCAVGVAA